MQSKKSAPNLSCFQIKEEDDVEISLEKGRNFDIAKTVVGSHNAFSIFHVETDIQIYIFISFYFTITFHSIALKISF